MFNYWSLLLPIGVSNTTLYGPLLALFTAVGYLGSVPFFWLAGKEYEKETIR